MKGMIYRARIRYIGTEGDEFTRFGPWYRKPEDARKFVEVVFSLPLNSRIKWGEYYESYGFVEPGSIGGYPFLEGDTEDRIAINKEEKYESTADTI